MSVWGMSIFLLFIEIQHLTKEMFISCKYNKTDLKLLFGSFLKLFLLTHLILV